MRQNAVRIAYIADSLIPGEAANSVHVMRMCEAFALLGHEVTLIARGAENPALAAADPFAFYGVRRIFSIESLSDFRGSGAYRYWAHAAANRAFRLMPSLVYSRSVAAATLTAEAGLAVELELHQLPPRLKRAYLERQTNLRRLFKYAGFIARKPFVGAFAGRREGDCFEPRILQYHGLWNVGGFASTGELFERLLNREKSLLRAVVITDRLQQDLAARYPQIESKMLVAADGACEPVTNSGHGRLARSCADWRLHVGFAGRLMSGKGLEVIAAVAPRCPDYRFHIVGGGGDPTSALESLLRGCPNVVFYGFVPHAEIAAHIADFDVCLLPNQPNVATHGGNYADIGRHTSPLKMFEYMAAGKPIVASDLAVLREVLVDRQNALLCAHDQPNSWVEALDRLAGDADLRTCLGNRAYREFHERFTWRERAKRVLAGLRLSEPNYQC